MLFLCFCGVDFQLRTSYIADLIGMVSYVLFMFMCDFLVREGSYLKNIN